MIVILCRHGAGGPHYYHRAASDARKHTDWSSPFRRVDISEGEKPEQLKFNIKNSIYIYNNNRLARNIPARPHAKINFIKQCGSRAECRELAVQDSL